MPVAKSKRLGYPDGIHHGLLTQVWDIGIQHSELYDKDIRKVVLIFEMPGLKGNDGLPRSISKFYTLSLDRKSNLRRDIESLLNKTFSEKEIAEGFEIGNILGTNCQLQIKNKENGKAEITNIMALPDGTKKVKAVTKMLSYDFGKPIPPEAPEFIVKLIDKAKDQPI